MCHYMLIWDHTGIHILVHVSILSLCTPGWWIRGARNYWVGRSDGRTEIGEELEVRGNREHQQTDRIDNVGSPRPGLWGPRPRHPGVECGYVKEAAARASREKTTMRCS